MNKILEILKRIFSKPENMMSPSWLKEHKADSRIEFHSVCWNWPVVKDL